MILQRLHIEGYKRLKHVDLSFPSAGIIGVVGANGAGKSTLFEAILWALFKPPFIDNRDVIPRGGEGGATLVELELETSDAVYRVTRSLRVTKGGSQRVDASVYRNDEMDPFVTGADRVTDYVRTTILRMSPASFMTTFFTRQKELAFFGALGSAERVREMQRLLDLDAIERAQRAVRDRRNDTRARLRGREQQLADDGGDRDFVAERAAAEQVLAAATLHHAELSDALDAVSQQYEAAEQRRDHLRAQAQRQERLQAEIATLTVRQDAARKVVEEATQRLARLAERAARADALAAVGAQLPALAARVAAADEAAAHALRVREAKRDRAQAEDAVAQLTDEVDARVRDLAPLADILFGWDEIADQPSGLARARTLATQLATAGPLAVERTWERDALRGITKGLEELTRAREDAKTRTGQRAQLDARIAAIAAGVDLDAEMDALTRLERRLAERLTALDTQLKATRAERQKTAALLAHWQDHDTDEPCPPCGRPFTAEDSAVMLSSLRRTIAACEHDEQGLQQEIDEIRRDGRKANLALQDVTGKRTQSQQLAAQRDRAIMEEEQAHDRATRAETALRDALTALGRRKPPTDQEMAALDQEATHLIQAAKAAEPAARLTEQIAAAERRVTASIAALAALGEPTYDAEEHAELTRERERLIALDAERANILHELGARPEIETRRRDGESAITEAAERIAALRTELGAVAFDPEAMQQATVELARLAADANDLTEQRTNAAVAVADARNAVENILKEEARLAAVTAEVAALARVDNAYHQMDDGFRDFSLALAARIQPRLGDYASGLLDRMTNGRYDRLTFGSDYSPFVYDGDVERFPIEKFSGGERDVAALAARIALSQMLAARGGHQIGFMVLDEVFGALDGERRSLVLDALATMRDVVPQLFIISHVDDVRLSPVMDEVWSVVAHIDGTSDILRKDAANLVLGAAAFSV
jgi:exonuclease SbcC